MGGDREGGFWTRTIRAPCHRTPPKLQGQACPQARKEETWYLRTRQGEGRGTHQRHRRVEKSRSLSVSPSSHFKPYRTIPSCANCIESIDRHHLHSTFEISRMTSMVGGRNAGWFGLALYERMDA